MKKFHMGKEKKYQTKRKMFVSYIVVPIVILTVFSFLFTFGYYRMSRKRNLAFENTICQNVNEQLKNVMDNILTTASQYSMTPWVKRLKYLQKIPERMDKNITASDISDYASMLSLLEINDSIIESVYIYYSLGDFGISSSGKISWEEYTQLYGIQSDNQDLMSGDLLCRNNQHIICQNVTLTKNAQKVSGFLLIQTIPLGNSYSGEANIVFFIPYSNIYDYIHKFTDEGSDELYLTDGQRVLYTQIQDTQFVIQAGDDISVWKSEKEGFSYYQQQGVYISEYTKTGMEIGVLQVLDNQFLYRDFFAFLKWIVMAYLLLICLIFVVSSKITRYSYQPIEHIMNLLEETQEDNVDEYQIIEKALKDLEDQKKKLETAVYEQNPLIEQYVLHGLMNGKNMNAVEEKYVNMMRQYSLYRSLVLSDSQLAAQYIREIDECLAVYPQIHTAFFKEGRYYFWIMSYGDDSLLDEIVDLLTQSFIELGHRDVVMAMSSVYDEIRLVPDACGQAVTALGCQFLYSDKKVILFDKDGIGTRCENEEIFEITPEETEKIRASVCETNMEELFEEYKRILIKNINEHLLNEKRCFDGIVRLNEIIMDIFRENKKFTEQIDMPEPEKFSNLESYLQMVHIKLENLAERCQARENPVYAARNEKIRQYVEAHLTDANLSLNETARIMHYTSTYFGKYFKEQFGCAFQQYVAVRRIECAKAYLHDDSDGRKLSIQEIALKCGFTNDVTFRRTFKRYAGMTPSQFDKEETVETEPFFTAE
jgi:AraC-like DNA-binding protein